MSAPSRSVRPRPGWCCAAPGRRWRGAGRAAVNPPTTTAMGGLSISYKPTASPLASALVAEGLKLDKTSRATT